MEMRRSNTDIQRAVDQLLSRYTSRTFFVSNDPPVPSFGLPEMVDAISDGILRSEPVIFTYCERLHNTRKGIFPKGITRKRKFTEKEIGTLMGVSGAAVSAKERYTTSMPIRKIDRKDLLQFCTIYDVSPHYLLGLVDDPQRCIVHENGRMIFTPSSIEGDLSQKEIIFPLWFDSAKIILRTRLIFIGLGDNPGLRDLLIHAATKCTGDTQERLLSCFKNWRGVDQSTIEDRLMADLNDDFKSAIRRSLEIDFVEQMPAIGADISIEHWFDENWGILFSSRVFEDARYRDENDYWNLLGYQNFEFLDYIAKISLADGQAKALIEGMLKIDGFAEENYSAK